MPRSEISQGLARPRISPSERRRLRARRRAERQEQKPPSRPKARGKYVPSPTKLEAKPAGFKSRTKTPSVAEDIVALGTRDVPYPKKQGISGFRSPFIQKFGTEIGEAGLYSGPGLYELAKALERDLEETKPKRFGGEGRYGFQRTRPIVEAMAKTTAEDIRHPLRHPGRATLTWLGAAGAAAGTTSRVAAGTRAAAEASTAAKAAGAGKAARAAKATKAAVSRPGLKGGSLAHRPTPGEIPIKVAGRTVGHVLEPDAPLPRAYTRRRAKIKNKLLEKPGRKPIPGPFGAFFEKVLAPEHTAGRAMRAERAIKADLAAAPATTLRRGSDKLTPEEHAALRVYAIEGNYALRHPDEAVSRHAGAHGRWAEEGIEPELNRTIAQDTAKAAAVLRDPRAHPNFVRVAGLSRRQSRASGREHVRRGHLTHEAEQSSRATIAEMYGHPVPGPPKGSFYFPTGEWFKPGSKVTQGKPSQPRPGPYGMGPPSQSLRGTGKKRTGEGVKRGVVEDVPGAIAENIVTRQRRYSAEDLYRLARSVGTPRKISEDQVGIRSTRRIRGEQRQLVRAEQAARQSGDATALARATQALRDFAKGRAEPIVEGAVGEQIPGVRWVDRRLLKESEAYRSEHVLAKGARAVNRPVRDFQVYFRPGYVATNLPGNVAMGAYLHGPKVATEMVRARKMRKGDPLTDAAEAAAGISRTESYGMGALQGEGRFARAEQKAVGVITDLTDRDFRLAMLRVRAAERGYKGDAGLRRLLLSDDPAVKADALAVSRRTRKDAVDFNSLTPAEKQLAEGIYFYPWISRGAFAWTGRTAVNRPVTTAALGALAVQGKERQPEWLKKAPRYLRGQIATRFGLVNPGATWTPASPVQTAESILHPRESYAAELGTPVVQALGTEPERIGGELIGTTGPGRIARATGLVTDPRIVGKPSKSFPETPRSVAGRWIFGGLYPVQPDKTELRERWLRELPPEQRIRERAKELPPAERADYIRRETRERERKDWPTEKRAYVKVFDERQEFYKAAKRYAPEALEKGRLPRKLRTAFSLEAERQRDYAKASEGLRSGTPEYHRARLAADLAFLNRHGILDSKLVDDVLRKAAVADVDTLRDTRRDISERWYQAEGGPLYYISHARRVLKEAGAVGLR